MKTLLVRHRGRTIQVSSPPGHQYGHLAIEIQLAIALAKANGHDVYFVRPPAVVNPALFDLETDEVRILRGPSLLTRYLDWRWRWAETVKHVGRWQCEIAKDAADELEWYIQNGELPLALRRALRRVRLRLEERADYPWDGVLPPSYLRRRLYVQRIQVRIPDALMPDVRAAAAKVGLDLDTPMVCVHAREPGFKRGREQENKGSARVDLTRNASIETHLLAIDYLVSRGYTVVRIGDPSMVPVKREGVVDLATSPHRSGLLEVACLLRCHFLLCGESGPFSVSFLTNTPMLAVNGTDLINAYPVRADGILVMKRVYDLGSGARLTPDDLISEFYEKHVRDVLRYAYLENTPEEILDAVKEMLELLAGQPEIPEQAAFRARTTQAAVGMRPTLSYVRKWGADEGFLGEGRLGRSQLLASTDADTLEQAREEGMAS